MNASKTVFEWKHRVVYSECTIGDHIYYARYLDILEEARGEFARSLGFPLRNLQDQGVIFPVVECHVQYRRPARYDQVLLIQLWVSLLSAVRLNIAARI